MTRKNILIVFIVSVSIILFFQNCANPVSPTGGIRDVTAPVLLNANPPQETVNFDAEKIKLTFDEYVELKDLTTQLIVSPPLDEKPDIRIKQKSIEIEFKEELKPNTTYNLFFGDAIVDITEGNPASNFYYVFSTGSVLDSMTFKGNVSDAFSLDAVEGISVMLYLNNNDTLPFDSLPYFVRPYFMSRTDENGSFSFFNLPNEDFKIFALEDGNSNLLFDQVIERVAFMDSLIHPYFIPPPPVIDTLNLLDSIAADSIIATEIISQIDTISVADSLLNPDSLKPAFIEPDPLQLLLFEEIDSVQKIIKGTLSEKNHLIFVFKRPVIRPEFQILNLDLSPNWKIEELHTNKDTISWWLKNIPADSMEIIVSDNNKILDTLKIAILKKSKKKKESEEEQKSPPLKAKFQKSIKFEQALNLSFKYPVINFVSDSILLVEGQDTLYTQILFNDSTPRKARIERNWLEKTQYRIEVPDSVFTDLLGRSNDTIKQTYTTPSIADFGNLLIHVNLSNQGRSHIIQLIKEEKIIKEFFLTSSEDIRMKYLTPGPYRLRIIFDTNNNHQWDPGHYIQGLSPEKVEFFPREITIRANWDVEEDWDL